MSVELLLFNQVVCFLPSSNGGAATTRQHVPSQTLLRMTSPVVRSCKTVASGVRVLADDTASSDETTTTDVPANSLATWLMLCFLMRLAFSNHSTEVKHRMCD